MTANFEQLRDAIQRELDTDCSDASEHGLDELLLQQTRGEQPGSALLRMMAALPESGYRNLDAAAREKWAKRSLATIAMEQSSSSENTRKPVRSSRDSPRRRTSRTFSTQNLPQGPEVLQIPLRQTGTKLRSTTLDRIEKLDIKTVWDALRHYPYRHHDFSQVVPISQLRVGIEQTVRGTVERAREVRMGRGGRMRSTQIDLSDTAGSRIRVVWFNQPYLARQLTDGAKIAVSGAVRIHRGRPTFQNPEFELISENGDPERHTGRLIPVYRLTDKLPQRTLRSLISGLVDRFAVHVQEPLPQDIRERHGLMPIAEATRQVHYPDNLQRLRDARRRLAFDELLAIQLTVVRRKREWQKQGDAPPLADRTAPEAFIASLPFTMTNSQQRATEEVLTDIERNIPMGRLLEGDVGSGKTIVALTAMLSAVAAGRQALLMVPTEVLAEQHYKTISTLLSGNGLSKEALSGEQLAPLNGVVNVPYLSSPLRVVLLTGSTRAKERRETLDAIRHGGADIVIGTHALIEQGVEFHDVGLAVVDEQHRFGVMQRSALREKGTSNGGPNGSPHLLVMTATPIPRSLALTVYGDLDLSVIDELPPGRTPISTHWLPPSRRHEAFDALRVEVEAGRQAFVICPLVEGSDAIASRAATAEYDRLCNEEYPDLAGKITLLHGRMSARDKAEAMSCFSSGQAMILVSTAVVEVGIDIPNATVMLIEGADRFGISQLHQFRGRVGRGEHPSRCFLLADNPTPEAEERLSTVERTNNGFELAQADLELRGPGDLYGTRQSGYAGLRIASLLDAKLIDAARREAEVLLDSDPELKSPKHRELRSVTVHVAERVVDESH